MIRAAEAIGEDSFFNNGALGGEEDSQDPVDRAVISVANLSSELASAANSGDTSGAANAAPACCEPAAGLCRETAPFSPEYQITYCVYAG
jgi:hypothetical protein